VQSEHPTANEQDEKENEAEALKGQRMTQAVQRFMTQEVS